LGLEDTHGERDLEAAILRELGRFLLTLGSFDTTYKGQMELYNPVALLRSEWKATAIAMPPVS